MWATPAELPRLLERAARVIDASGLIVWVADRAGTSLFPDSRRGLRADRCSRAWAASAAMPTTPQRRRTARASCAPSRRTTRSRARSWRRSSRATAASACSPPRCATARNATRPPRPSPRSSPRNSPRSSRPSRSGRAGRRSSSASDAQTPLMCFCTCALCIVHCPCIAAVRSAPHSRFRSRRSSFAVAVALFLSRM